ncbi:RNA polymerase sigma factor, partial [Clostridium perfringens]
KKERQVIEYKFLVGKSDSEIGEMLNISRQAINKTKNRALNKLKEFI